MFQIVYCCSCKIALVMIYDHLIDVNHNTVGHHGSLLLRTITGGMMIEEINQCTCRTGLRKYKILTKRFGHYVHYIVHLWTLRYAFKMF